MVRRVALCTLALVALLDATGSAAATETENHGIAILPAPGKVVVDGKVDDWDLSGGVFACNDVENQRDTFAAWIHAMYDRDALYLLARWRDETPMNNPRERMAGMGFNGDCLQFRIITHPGTPEEHAPTGTPGGTASERMSSPPSTARSFHHSEGKLADAKAHGESSRCSRMPTARDMPRRSPSPGPC